MQAESQEFKAERPRVFQSSFCYAIAIPLFLLGGFGGGYLFCGIAFLFGFVGWLKAKSLPARISGVVIAGVTGGFFAMEIWSAYF